MTVKPPFTRESAKQVVQNAQDAWNSQNSEKIAQGYAINSQWRNRTAFFTGRKAIIEFLNRKWEKELDYILKKEIWAFADNKISVRFEYEWRDADSCQWYRTHGNEHWEFDNDGLMKIRDMSANDIPILESQRRIWRKQ